jgi:hypothetical protein
MLETDATVDTTLKRRFAGAVVSWPLLALGVGIAALAVLLFVVPDIFIPDTSLGWVDAWYYVGFARNLPEKLARYHQLYQSERITWTLPAYVFNRIAPPLIANYMVKGVFFLATTVFLFGSVREITGSLRTAAFVSGLAAFHSFLVHSLGTSYVDGPMNTYVLGTIYFSTRAFQNPTRIGNAFLAGAFFGCQLFAHLASLALLPSFAIYWLMTWMGADARKRNLPLFIIGLQLGIVSVVVVVIALYAHWGPDSLPLLESLRFFFSRTSNPSVDPSNGGWLQQAFWLLLPTAVVALALIPSYAIYYLMTWVGADARERKLRLFIVGLQLGIVSVVAVVIALYAHWGPDAFPVLRTSNSWVDPSNGAWLQQAFWLLLPTAVVAWIVMAIGSSLSISWSAPLRLPAAFWLLLSVYFCWVALYFRSQPWLMLPYYSSCLIAPTFLALGPISTRSVDALSANAYTLLLTGLFVASGITYWLSGPGTIEPAVMVALACLAAATALRLRWVWNASPAFPMLLVGAAASINYATADYGVQLPNAYRYTAMKTYYRPANLNGVTRIPRAERFKAAISAAERLDRRLSGNSGRWYFFWYDGHDELGMFYRSMTSLLFAWSTSHLLGEDFHDFDQRNRETLASYSVAWMRDLVILTRRPHITPPDSRFTIQWTDREEVGGIEYFVYYLAFQPLPTPGKS